MTQDNDVRVPATPQALEEALGLSGEILADVELNRAPLSAIALKTSRLGRSSKVALQHSVHDSASAGFILLESGEA